MKNTNNQAPATGATGAAGLDNIIPFPRRRGRPRNSLRALAQDPPPSFAEQVGESLGYLTRECLSGQKTAFACFSVGREYNCCSLNWAGDAVVAHGEDVRFSAPMAFSILAVLAQCLPDIGPGQTAYVRNELRRLRGMVKAGARAHLSVVEGGRRPKSAEQSQGAAA